MTLHEDASNGTLTAASLDEYLKTQKIDDVSTESGNGTKGLTPLAVAARNGHVDTVRLLLDKKAAVDGLSSQNRTPLWIVTSRGKGEGRVEIVGLLLNHKANAKYSHPDLKGSTPLENELQQRKDPEVIKLLVDADGVTPKAKELAEKLDQPDIDNAMLPKWERSQLKSAVVNLITSFILFVLAWANSKALTGVVEGIFKKFGIRGTKDSATAKQIAEEIPEPKTKEEFKKSTGDFIKKHKLGKFFPRSDDPFLETLVAKAVDIQNDENNNLGKGNKTEDLVKFALYQPVIYCDDSGSMDIKNNHKEDRMGALRDLVHRIASICTQLVPDDKGVHLRCINADLPNADDLRMDTIETTMKQLKADGMTEIGTNLRKKILEPLVYNRKLDRPVLVSIITDGVPYGEKETKQTLKNEIIACQEWLLEHKYPSRSVVFQLSQIGSDENAKDFIDGLSSDKRLKGVLYCTAEQLDAKYHDLRANEDDLEAWLFQTLLTPVLDLHGD